MRTPWLCSLCLLLAPLLAHCGGPPGSGPNSANDADDGSSDDGDGDRGADGAATAAADDSPTLPSCDDGTCSPCGDGICPSGWYCDQGASGGPACSWLKECADKPSCGCVTRVLDQGCKCSEEGGGLNVSCG